MKNNHKSKYLNTKVTRDGIIFDSRKEADYYMHLKARERVGEVSNIRLQVPFELLPKQYKTETVQMKTKTKEKQVLVEREVVYVADFVYFDKSLNGNVVADVKNEHTKTQEYIIKRKLMYYMYGIKILEV